MKNPWKKKFRHLYNSADYYIKNKIFGYNIEW